MVALGWWAREAMRRDPTGAAAVLFSGQPDSPVRTEPAGLAGRLDLDVLFATTAAWSRDGQTFALCGMPGVSFRKLMPKEPTQPWEIPKAQKEQQRVAREALTSRVLVVNAITGASRALPRPEPDAEVEETVWWPDGRLLVLTRKSYSPTEDKPTRDSYGPRRVWLVNPDDGHAERISEVNGHPRLAVGRVGVAFSVTHKNGDHETYVLLPQPGGPVLTRLRADIPYGLSWDALGNLYAWGSGAEGERWAVARVFLPAGTTSACSVQETSGRSAAPLMADEVLTTRRFPPGGGTRAFYALNPGLGRARRLSEALPDTADYPRARFLGGRWILVEQERYRDNRRVYRLYGYNIPQGRFYPVTDWGALEMLVTQGTTSPEGNLLLLEKTARPENFLRIFTSGLSSEAWLLRLDERQLLAQDPTSAEEWKIKPGEECPKGG